MVRVVLIGVLLMVGCSPTPVVPEAATDCGGACEVLGRLGCQESLPTPQTGAECASWCVDYHRVDYMPPWADCVAIASSIDSVRECGLGCELIE